MRNLNDFQEQLHLAMPVPAFLRSPRPQQPGPEESPLPQSSSRLSALHFNVRSIVNGSSIYSRSPNASNNNTPKIPFLGFMRRPQSPQPNTMADDNRPDSSDSRSPLRPQFRVESYIRVIEPLQYPSAEDGVIDRHPADVSLEYGASEDPEAQHTHDSVNHRRRRRHRRRKHTRSNRSTHWVRKKGFIKTHAARAKLCACVIAGLFLVTVLAVYLGLALTQKAIGQEIHVLFIMIILAITIFFCHSVIRLFMLALHPPEETPRIPSMTGPEGFHPIRPIRVHVARDEELEDHHDVEIEDIPDPEKKVTPPPPAYGLWRSSVRVDPNLLHWQRVETNANTVTGYSPTTPAFAQHASVPEIPRSPDLASHTAQENQGPRPPSYVSEDGVSYIVEAAPRSVAPSHSGVSEIHPAWRPGYAISEVPYGAGDWPAPLRV